MGGHLKNYYKTIGNFRYLTITAAGFEIIRKYASSNMLNKTIERDGKAVLAEFRRNTAGLDVSGRWFDYNVRLCYWLFETWASDRSTPLEMLEIGSWEGLSANFMLWQFPAARLTCVDTWEGSDEHRDGSLASGETLTRIESRFDGNCRPYADRIVKRKQRSSQFFAGHDPDRKFDLIYVDGSHHAHDVVEDALGASRLAKAGGVIVFDDYLWRHYPRTWQNPAPAINWFIRSARDEFEILYVGAQVILQKRPAAEAST